MDMIPTSAPDWAAARAALMPARPAPITSTSCSSMAFSLDSRGYWRSRTSRSDAMLLASLISPRRIRSAAPLKGTLTTSMFSSSSGLRAPGREAPGHVGVHQLGAETGSRPEAGQVRQLPRRRTPSPRGSSRRGRVLRALPGVHPPRGDLQEGLLHGLPVLPHHHHVAVVVQGDDAHAGDVLHYLPGAQPSLGQAYGVHSQVHDLAFVSNPAVN